ncbi:MAG TPA: septum formation initiator family protein [Acidimicrobiia bacterium]|nr:septum formation initiator family protein [Acidimicrobiia bacterium]HTC80799.1 septum formation initiator family protein [Acidimicrobiia bacterium]
MSSKARIVVAFVIFIGILFGAVYPTRTYLAQQRDLRAAHQKLALFKQQNGHLEAEAKRLESDEEIERIARARFNLVKPGEEAYAIVPVPPKPGDPASAAAAAATPPPAPAAKRSSLPDAVVDWMVSALQRVF